MSNPLLLPPNLSYSQKSTLSDCGGRYYLERGLRVPQRPGWANVGGTAAHSTTEELDRRLYGAGEHVDDLGAIQDIFHSYFRQETEKTERVTGFNRTEFRSSGRASREWPDKENHLWWGQQGPLMALAWVRWRDASPYRLAEVDGVDLETGEAVKVLAIELECRMGVTGLPDEVDVHAFVDRLLVTDTDTGPEYRVLDLKFGIREPASADQLLTYRFAVRDTFGVDPRWGTYWMGRKGMNTPDADLHRTPYEQVAYDYRMAHRQRMAGDFRYHPSTICVACSVNAYCPVFGGQYADTVEQPWDATSPPGLAPPRVQV